MSRSRPPKFYAVKRGRLPGIYSSWEECEAQVKNFPSSTFKSFKSIAEANVWLTAGVDEDTQAQDINLRSSSISTFVDRGGGGGRRPQKRRRMDEDEDGGLNVEEEEVVYCDGACKGNGEHDAVAGIGVWWGKDDPRNLAERCPGAQTNNRAELIAVARALEIASISKKRLTIKTDSKYVIQCIDNWIHSWIRNGWRTFSGEPVKNLSIIRYIHGLLVRRRKRGQQVVLIHVRGHAGISGNEEADALASMGTGMPEVEEREWEALRRVIEGDDDDDNDDGWDGDRITGGGERSREVCVERRVGTRGDLIKGKGKERDYEVDFGEGSSLGSVKVVGGSKLHVQVTSEREELLSAVRVTEKTSGCSSSSVVVNENEVDFDLYKDDLLDDEELEMILREEG